MTIIVIIAEISDSFNYAGFDQQEPHNFFL